MTGCPGGRDRPDQFLLVPRQAEERPVAELPLFDARRRRSATALARARRTALSICARQASGSPASHTSRTWALPVVSKILEPEGVGPPPGSDTSARRVPARPLLPIVDDQAVVEVQPKPVVPSHAEPVGASRGHAEASRSSAPNTSRERCPGPARRASIRNPRDRRGARSGACPSSAMLSKYSPLEPRDAPAGGVGAQRVRRNRRSSRRTRPGPGAKRTAPGAELRADPVEDRDDVVARARCSRPAAPPRRRCRSRRPSRSVSRNGSTPPAFWSSTIASRAASSARARCAAWPFQNAALSGTT